MQRALLVFFIVIDIALVCLIVQTLISHRRSTSDDEVKKYQDIVDDFEKKKVEAREFQGTGWGTVRGRIVFGDDTIPERQPIDMGRFKVDADACLKRFPLLREDWVVNKDNKGVRWTFVWLAQEPILRREKLAIHDDLKKAPETEVVIDTPCYAFVPHAVALREGQVLVIQQSGDIRHNVNVQGLDVAEAGRLLDDPSKPQRVKLRSSPQPMKLGCNVHPWMIGIVRVFDHPYFAITDESGRFEIKQAPAGKYRLMVWHESAGALTMNIPITIKNNEVTDVGDKELKPTK